MDITEVILNDHHEQRRAFAVLDDVDRQDTGSLTALWERTRILLEVHVQAEEEVFYPRLLEVGTGAGGKDSVEDEVEDVLKDHNEIRDALQAVGRHEVGSAAWWKAVVTVREANSEHMAEEEREDLADFRHHADLQQRHELAVAFLAFQARHPTGVRTSDKDPKEYVRQGG